MLSSLSTHAQNEVDSIKFYGKTLLNPDREANLPAAFNYFEKSLIINLNEGDTLEAVKKLRHITIGQIEVGALFAGEETATRALLLLENQPTDSLVINLKKGIYNDLGMIYRILKNPDNAFRFYNESLKYCLNAQDSMHLVNNMGNIYVDQGNFELAEEQFRSSYELSKKSTDFYSQARFLDNLGFSQSKLGLPVGLQNMLTALKIRHSNNDLAGLYASYSHLAKHYYGRGEQKEALEYAEKAYHLAHRLKRPSYIENSLANLLEIREDSLSREYIKLNDSIAQAKLQRRNKYAGMQYNLLKEKRKTEQNRLLQEKEKRKKQGYQYLGILLFLTLIAIYFIQRAQNRKNTIKQIYNTETRISKKLHDEVANDMYHLMTKIQLGDPDPEKLLDDLDLIYNKTRDLSRDNAALIIEEDFGSQLKDLLNSYKQDETVITTQNISQVDWKTISPHKKTTIYRLLQEIMTNMKKHSQASQVLISFSKNGKKLQIKYVDNGVGCKLKNKNGLENMESRIKAVKGSIIFETSPQKGFRVTITI
ncbi:tetratricopeptide repeat-containing sensor histidine kinase [Aequorivita ciconiae]|nr:tetratricopeptide repeat protein [Aequorivita sp. H23M31]